jgi:hypothetical protein
MEISVSIWVRSSHIRHHARSAKAQLGLRHWEDGARTVGRDDQVARADFGGLQSGGCRGGFRARRGLHVPCAGNPDSQQGYQPDDEKAILEEFHCVLLISGFDTQHDTSGT